MTFDPVVSSQVPLCWSLWRERVSLLRRSRASTWTDTDYQLINNLDNKVFVWFLISCSLKSVSTVSQERWRMISAEMHFERRVFVCLTSGFRDGPLDPPERIRPGETQLGVQPLRYQQRWLHHERGASSCCRRRRLLIWQRFIDGVFRPSSTQTNPNKSSNKLN